MKKVLTMAATTLLLCTAAPLTYAEQTQHPHWSYDGVTGPENWGELADEFRACKLGKSQAPVNLDSQHEIEADLPALDIRYQPGGAHILNNGHTVQVNYESGSTLTLDGRTFELKQLHFHTPSENLVDGQAYPMEMHLVHADADGHLAVIGVMFMEGEANAALEQFWPELPSQQAGTKTLGHKVDASALLPDNRDYHRYSGSLTTPPCSEDVIWLVMKQPLTGSRDEFQTFTNLIGRPNARPVQPVNSRPILK